MAGRKNSPKHAANVKAHAERNSTIRQMRRDQKKAVEHRRQGKGERCEAAVCEQYAEEHPEAYYTPAGERGGSSHEEVSENFPRDAAKKDYKQARAEQKQLVSPLFVDSKSERFSRAERSLRRATMNQIMFGTAMMDAAVAHGYDGEGLGGLRGFCRLFMEVNPTEFWKSMAHYNAAQVLYAVTGNIEVACSTAEEARIAIESRGLPIDSVYDKIIEADFEVVPEGE